MKKKMGKHAWSRLADGGSVPLPHCAAQSSLPNPPAHPPYPHPLRMQPLFVGVEIYIIFVDGSKELAALLEEVGSPMRGVKPLGLREVAGGSLGACPGLPNERPGEIAISGLCFLP